MDLVALYTQTQDRIVDLVTPLSAPALAGPVPGTPRWTVVQLVAHLAGVCHDVGSGEVDGAATEPWTARQVAAREGRTLPALLAEWRDRTPALLTMLAAPGRADSAAFDILTHEHDLRGALGLAGASDPAAAAAVTARVTGRLNHLVDKHDLPGLRLVADDGEWVCGSAGVAVAGTAPTMEWFRALFGRRSASQILTYRWEGDPTPYFPMFSLFGPLPSADVAEAGAPVPGAS
ncbi:MAG TPA: maleylpyruvate isomerase family mycothiol-dependent enzyme [Acidimicrobiales bacterium]|nr:maleylpyruvate isomerase family mycothiol-dependent enzyme [Acidimicrobiales bacterium]